LQRARVRGAAGPAVLHCRDRRQIRGIAASPRQGAGQAAARGSGGGYRFSGNAKRVTLLHVIALFETIGSKAPRAPRRELERAVDQVLAEIDETAKATFGSITLETLLKLVRRRW